MSENQIGVARVTLQVDAETFDRDLDYRKNAVVNFGKNAAAAFDASEGSTRRAAERLLDYVSNLGKADTRMQSLITTARRAGVVEDVIEAAADAWRDFTNNADASERMLARVTAASKELTAEQNRVAAASRAAANAQAQMYVEGRASQQAQNYQGYYNSTLGVNDTSSEEQSRRRADAESAFLAIIEAENAALRQQETIAETIANERERQSQQNAQAQFNSLLGVGATPATQLGASFSALEAQLNEVAVAEREAFGHNANVDAFISQLNSLNETAGKSHYEILQLKADQLGVGQAATPLIQKLKQTNEALGQGTLTTKQYEFAMRGVPAQITDIVTSLVSGQPAYLVALQQGGQLKDMFGGVGAAAKALGSTLLKYLMNPWVLAGVAITGVVAAVMEAQSVMQDFAIASAKGDGFAGSAEDLNNYATQLSKLDGINLSSAREAVQGLAADGKLTGENFMLAAQASAYWASVTGEKASEVGKVFETIADDPLKAIEQGMVRVTDAQYASVTVLEQQGDKQGAVNELTKIYYDQVEKNAASVESHLSETTKLWSNIKDTAGTAVENIAAAVNWTLKLADATNKATGNKQASTGIVSLLGGNTAGGISQLLSGYIGSKFFNSNSASAAGMFSDVTSTSMTAGTSGNLTQAQIDANKQLQSAWDASGTDAEKLATKVAKLNANLREASAEELKLKNITKTGTGASATFSGAGYDRLVAALQPKTHAGAQQDPTQAIKQWEKTQLDALKGVEDATKASYQDMDISIEDYYAKQNDFAKQTLDIQTQSINKQIAALDGQKDRGEKIKKLQEELATDQQTYANTVAANNRDETKAVQERNLAWDEYIQKLNNATDALARQGKQAVYALGHGADQAGLNSALSNRQNQYDLAIQGINNKYANAGDDGQKQAQDERDAQLASLQADQKQIIQNYSDLRAAESDWLTGANKAWQDFLHTANDTASATASLFNTAFSGIGDNLAKLIVTGKADFGDLLTTIAEGVLKIGINKGIADIGSALFGGSSSSGGTTGSIFDLFSGSFGVAHGAAFPAGALTSYRNSIVSNPTFFPFAKGGVPNVGLMGEVSGKSEAVMPLTRLSGGDLGVKVTQSQGQAPAKVEQNFYVQGTPDRRTQQQLAKKAGAETNRALKRR